MLGSKSQKIKPNSAKGKGQGQGQAKGQGKGKPQKKQDEDEELNYGDDDDDLDEIDDDENDLGYDDDDNEEDDDDDLFLDLFWKMEIKPGKESILEQPENIDGIVCVTNACFGQNVNKGSRTVVSCKSGLSEESIPICVLNEGVHENERLNLKFGTSAIFTLQGTAPSTVYLTGFVQPDNLGDELPDDLDMEDDIDYEDHFSKKFPSELATKKRKLELPQKPAETKKQQPKKEVAPKTQPPKKDNEAKTPAQKKDNENKTPAPKKDNENKTPAPKKDNEAKTPAQKKETEANNNSDNNDNNNSNSDAQGDKPLTKSQKRNQKKKLKKQNEVNNNESKDTTSEQPKETANETKEEKTESNDKGKTPKKDVKLSSGIEYKDLKEGTGEEVQNGQTLVLYYVGQLEDKKVFDKVLSGEGFEYKLGSDEPIKGWSLGIKGMKVGSKRRIVIPPKFAYGAEGSSAKGVPANSTITYTIEVKSTK